MKYPTLAQQVGKRVSDLRHNLGMSVAQFANHCDIDRDTIYAIEAGDQDNYLYMVLRIAKATNTPSEELLKGLEEFVGEEFSNCKKK